VPLTTALTDEFLEEHELMSLRDAVILIIRLIPSVHWKDELRKLSGIPAYLIDALGTAMDEDMHGRH
jgi:RNase adaptor protein for sRNA GlmZ degradation